MPRKVLGEQIGNRLGQQAGSKPTVCTSRSGRPAGTVDREGHRRDASRPDYPHARLGPKRHCVRAATGSARRSSTFSTTITPSPTTSANRFSMSSPAPAPTAWKRCRAGPRSRPSSTTIPPRCRHPPQRRRASASTDRRACCASMPRGWPPRRGSPRTPAALAFLDPPYAADIAGAALGGLHAHGWLASGRDGRGRSRRNAPLPPPPGYALHDERTYGAGRGLLSAGNALGRGATSIK